MNRQIVRIAVAYREKRSNPLIEIRWAGHNHCSPFKLGTNFRGRLTCSTRPTLPRCPRGEEKKDKACLDPRAGNRVNRGELHKSPPRSGNGPEFTLQGTQEIQNILHLGTA